VPFNTKAIISNSHRSSGNLNLISQATHLEKEKKKPGGEYGDEA
jgi:hypothetical protein